MVDFNKKLIVLICLLTLATVFVLSSCYTPDKQQKIIDTFNSFDNSEEYILITPGEIHVGKNIINIRDLNYNTSPCYVIAGEQNGAYAYSHNPQSEFQIDILFFEYETQSLTLLSSLTLPDKILGVDYSDNAFYFETKDPSEGVRLYYIYDVITAQTQIVDSSEISDDAFKSQDHNRSELFSITTESSIVKNQTKVTKKSTGETKYIDNSLLATCTEGQAIYNLGRFGLGSGSCAAYEKDGYIYTVHVYYVDGALGYPCCYYIMRYDFEAHSFEYYTAIMFEQDPESIKDLFIP